MTSAGVAQLKASLSEYLGRVKSGEEVVVTERGHAIARIVPISPFSSDSRSIEELIRVGILRRPREPFDRKFLEGKKPEDPEASVLRALRAERDETP